MSTTCAGADDDAPLSYGTLIKVSLPLSVGGMILSAAGGGWWYLARSVGIVGRYVVLSGEYWNLPHQRTQHTWHVRGVGMARRSVADSLGWSGRPGAMYATAPNCNLINERKIETSLGETKAKL